MSTEQQEVVASTVVVDSTERVWPIYDHDIGMAEARQKIGRWKRANPAQPGAVAITKVGLDRVLNQPGCVGARAYYAMNDDMTVTLVFVGVDEFGNDLDEGELADKLYPCPPFCAINSALDS